VIATLSRVCEVVANVSQLLLIARGDAPADLVLRGGRIVNVFSGQIERADIAIVDGLIAGVGEGYAGKETIDLNGAYVAPGLIDAHVHIESSLCIPQHFASAVVPRGVTTVVADPHEIANVAGAAGVRFMADMARSAAVRVVQMAPSCVPATDMGTSGAALDANDLADLRRDGIVRGLAEVMNYPGVVRGEGAMLAKIAAFHGRPIDGHCPNLRGKALNAYVAAGIGSEHECVSVDEAREKLARGMYILIREASNARNLDALLPLITPASIRRICLCTDDRTPRDLLEHGSVDEMLRRVIAAGVEPYEAFRLCTLNPSDWFGLHDRGAIAPGRVADLFVFDELEKPVARRVFVAGREIAAISVEAPHIPQHLSQTCRVQIDASRLVARGRGSRIRVIGSLPDQLITENRVRDAVLRNGQAVADVSRDVLKIAVIERHRGTGNVGIGFIEGIGLKRGAIAGTVAHDHHNLIVIGCDDTSMTTAVRASAASNGGLVAAAGESVLASLPLPVAGLMSDRPVNEVGDAYTKLLSAATRELGSVLRDPFMAMSFMALEVIPSLKLTDQGLVDVEAFRKVDLFV
jgi:adenine deaminase